MRKVAYKVLIPEDITAPGKDFLKSRGYEVVVVDGTASEAFEREARDTDALLARTAKYPAEILRKLPELKVIGRHGVGYDNIDMDYCNEKKIRVTITPNANSNAVAEHTVMMLLACAKNLIFQNRQVMAGNWNSRNQCRGEEVTGKTVGIVGCGRIGKQVARKAALGLDMRVIGYDPVIPMDVKLDHMERVPTIEELFREADFVSLHLPETAETRGMINKDLLSLMKPTASLINCARGGIVNEDDLYEALSTHRIHGAGVDVLTREPYCPDDRLLKLDNLIVTPHNAALNTETMNKMGLDAARGIDEVLSGQSPSWPVNKF